MCRVRSCDGTYAGRAQQRRIGMCGAWSGVRKHRAPPHAHLIGQRIKLVASMWRSQQHRMHAAGTTVN